MTVLDQSKTLAESALQMLYAAKEGGGNPKVQLPCVTKGLLETGKSRGWLGEGRGQVGQKKQHLPTAQLKDMFAVKMPLMTLLTSHPESGKLSKTGFHSGSWHPHEGRKVRV